MESKDVNNKDSKIGGKKPERLSEIHAIQKKINRKHFHPSHKIEKEETEYNRQEELDAIMENKEKLHKLEEGQMYQRIIDNHLIECSGKQSRTPADNAILREIAEDGKDYYKIRNLTLGKNPKNI